MLVLYLLNLLPLFLLIAGTSVKNPMTSGVSAKRACTGYLSCGDCVGAAGHCVWCFADDHKTPRCQNRNYFTKNEKTWCPEKYVEDPKVAKINTVTDKALSEVTGKVVQIRPQKVSMETRAGLQRQFNIRLRPATDYPVDVYFLMDPTWSMRYILRNATQVAHGIFKSLKKQVNNVRFGVGSFVDKKALPIAGLSNKAYSFRHHLNLTEDLQRFEEKMSHLEELGASNNDDQEAGFDGLMQVMTCKERFGWRDDSSKIIILFTDGSYHSAGDGRLVGADVPNDMQCHLDEQQGYSEQLTFDYPSVSQINKVARDTHTKIIFAVTENVQADYKVLTNAIKGSAVVTWSSTETNAFIKMINDEYSKLRRYLYLNVEAPPHYLVSFDPPCDRTAQQDCTLKHKQQKLITVKILLKSCPNDTSGTDEITIRPFGYNEKLTISVTTKCGCQCQTDGAGKCENGGEYECGVCKCKENTYGERCGCKGDMKNMFDQKECMASDTDAVPCSGRGTCRCGKCEDCEHGSGGLHCEFEKDHGCPNLNQQTCSGNGLCVKTDAVGINKCDCYDGWTGPGCSCHDADCTNPQTNEVCSGKGNCVCGRCVCTETTANNEAYWGPTCDECTSCGEKKCTELAEYAYCNRDHEKQFCDTKFNVSIEVKRKNKTDMNAPEFQIAKWCKDEKDGSSTIFLYYYDENSVLKVVLQNELEVPSKANIWTVAGSVVGSMLLLAVLSYVAWIIFDHVQTSREYEKFSAEAKAAGFDISNKNPLYEDPVVNYRNPHYEKF